MLNLDFKDCIELSEWKAEDMVSQNAIPSKQVLEVDLVYKDVDFFRISWNTITIVLEYFY